MVYRGHTHTHFLLFWGNLCLIIVKMNNHYFFTFLFLIQGDGLIFVLVYVKKSFGIGGNYKEEKI